MLKPLCVRQQRNSLLSETFLAVHAGEIVGIAAIGRNGQSQLVEAIMGMCRTDSGEIFINGETICGKIRDRSVR